MHKWIKVTEKNNSVSLHILSTRTPNFNLGYKFNLSKSRR
uniref:Uncharacterized protein n=1 Tax=Rhizophora mucronata TaxID=61149 RepID=A0A2P2PDG7_RHIMU